MTVDKFSYQKLRVYEDMIGAISLAEGTASSWDSIHAITDHLGRASEGALVCLAEACRARQTPAKHQAAGYSLGSILECAGCFNIAEGNGRFAHLDHSRFLEIANRSNTKLTARLEICAARGGIDQNEASELIGLLVQIDKMTAQLAEVWRVQGE